MEKIKQIILKIQPNYLEVLKKSKFQYSFEDYSKKIVTMTLTVFFACTLILFFLFSKLKVSFLFLLLLLVPLLLGTFFFFMKVPEVYLKRRKNEIEKNVLFVGRYLLIKMESGSPLYSALEGASNGYGETSKLFKDIMIDINTGSTVEDALENAMNYCPSETFARIIWEIKNAVETGVDITNALRGIVDQITAEQIIEIQKYSKKLNSLTLFYMILAVVMPSLGMTLAVIITSFLNVQVSLTILMFIAFMLAFLQYFFLSLFKSIRPSVEM